MFDLSAVQFLQLSSQSKNLQQIMPMEELATHLAKHIHRQAQRANSDLDTAKYDEQSLDTSFKNPGISKVRQNERKHVFEDDQTSKRFNCNVSVCIE